MFIESNLVDRTKEKFPYTIQLDSERKDYWSCANQCAALGTWASTIGILSFNQTFYFQNKEDLDAFRLLIKIKGLV